ncbi:phage tail protein [Yokenella regensburgei]|uniref:Phage tail fibre repeat n=3 Tax=Yokenella regensburgei TaxID=158877 RepID=A0AB38FXL7_9ENTR|nr:phage tail protein [Yokenella regensburgei]SQA62892.1 Phage tail fibre repeat [Yokenella regensburgei]SQA95401.1 Phage tail fibre repeat [Yokenella regensburgei]SUQ03020.1 Phage tail fibre repeat [Yokenella regensburgei]
MATKYLALLTNIGAAKLAKATALGTKVEITQLAVGDGNGVLPTPNPAQTALVHELRRAPLNMLTVDPANASQIIAEQVIPEDVGGWWIREIGLFDKDGDMVAIANCAETYKPQLQEGSGRVQVIRVILIVSSTEAVTLKIDPAVVLATRQYVDSQLRAHEQSRNHPDASTTEKGFVQLSSSVTSDSESQAATSKAVKIAMDNGSARLAKDRNLSDLPNTALARQNLELGDSSTRNVGTTAGTVASGDDARITGAMQKSQNGGDIPDVAKFLQNLGLKEAAKRDVGTGTNQIPDMTFFTQGFLTTENNQFAGFLALPRGMVVQYGRVALYNTSNVATINLPVSYADTNYAVIASSDLAVKGNTLYPWFGARPHTASQIDMQQSTNTDGYACYWITVGRVS